MWLLLSAAFNTCVTMFPTSLDLLYECMLLLLSAAFNICVTMFQSVSASQHNSTTVGDILSYSCADGNALVGDDELACWYNGETAIWDGYANGCKKRE